MAHLRVGSTYPGSDARWRVGDLVEFVNTDKEKYIGVVRSRTSYIDDAEGAGVHIGWFDDTRDESGFWSRKLTYLGHSGRVPPAQNGLTEPRPSDERRKQ